MTQLHLPIQRTRVRLILSSTALLLVVLLILFNGPITSARSGVRRIVRVEGELEIAYEDSHGHSRLVYFVKTATKKFEVKFSRTPAQTLRTGMHVTVTGVQNTATLELNSGEVVETSGAPLVAANALGQHRVLVVMVNFQDKQTQPFTVAQAQSVMFGTTSDFYREASYGQTWLTGDVYGWYTIPVSSTTCDTTAISNYAQQAAVAAGANIASYDHVVYAFPQNACTWQGRGSVGGSPSQAWINEWFELGIVGHELGHNLGLYHSRSMDCGAVSIGGTCSTDEYGDVFDLMGAANSAHFNSYQKERLGWMNAGSNPPITTVTASGTYWVDSFESGTLIPKALKILKSIDPVSGSKTWYYVERRTASGFDNFLAGNTNVLSGVIVRTGSESNAQDTYLLDMTPGTTSWYDPALTVGQSFTDSVAGVSITTVSADAYGAFVDITVAAQPCVRANPTVSVTPSQTQWMRSGDTATFNVSVRNNDSGGCGASSFNAQATVPAGWTSNGSVISVGAGATASSTVQVTSPVGAPDGNYSLSITSSNVGSPGSFGSAAATYSLVSTLAVTSSATQTTYTRNQTATVNTTVKAAGTLVSGATVTFTMTKSNGATVTSTTTTGANGVAVFKYSFNRKKDPAGTYQVRSQATANGISSTGSVSFVVK